MWSRCTATSRPFTVRQGCCPRRLTHGLLLAISFRCEKINLGLSESQFVLSFLLSKGSFGCVPR